MQYTYGGVHIIYEDYFFLQGFLEVLRRLKNSMTPVGVDLGVLLISSDNFFQTFHLMFEGLKMLSSHDLIVIIGTDVAKKIVSRMTSNKKIDFLLMNGGVDYFKEVFEIYFKYGAITTVFAGRELNLLTLTESRVLKMISLGFTPVQIASQLRVSVKTVSNQKRSAMRKLNISTSTELWFTLKLDELIHPYLMK